VEVLPHPRKSPSYIDLSSASSSSGGSDTPCYYTKRPKARPTRVSSGTPHTVDFLSFSQFSDDKNLKQFADLEINIGCTEEIRRQRIKHLRNLDRGGLKLVLESVLTRIEEEEETFSSPYVALATEIAPLHECVLLELSRARGAYKTEKA
jgi:hypothetical protein